MAKLTIQGTTLGDGIRAMGPFFVEQLREDAETAESPAGIKRDWFTVAEWLDHSGGPLSEEQKSVVSKAWLSYIAIGVAPSNALQPTFDQVSTELVGETNARPPSAILDVFDRLLATDEELSIKRQADVRAERQKFQSIFAEATSPSRKQKFPETRRIRQLIFLSVTWAMAVYLYAWLFDPFDVGGWADLDTEHENRLLVISLLPPALFALIAAYRKWVR